MQWERCALLMHLMLNSSHPSSRSFLNFNSSFDSFFNISWIWLNWSLVGCLIPLVAVPISAASSARSRNWSRGVAVEARARRCA